MKKTATLILSIIIAVISILIPFPTSKVYADYGKYLRVITEDTPFYQSPTDKGPLFYLPYTYYVKALETVDGFVHVECYGQGGIAGLDGYVPLGYLFDDGLTVANPFVVLEITTVNTAILYADSTLLEPLQYLFANRELKYYGSITSGEENLYYVSYNNRLGYVRESDVFPFSIANHPNELTFIIPEEPIPEEQPQVNSEQDFFTLKMVIIACLVFAGIMALVVALNKKPNKSVAVGYYDDNDYE